ncbi:MAG: S8 family serine peptidase [Patescibacteria group bacterium]
MRKYVFLTMALLCVLIITSSGYASDEAAVDLFEHRTLLKADGWDGKEFIVKFKDEGSGERAIEDLRSRLGALKERPLHTARDMRRVEMPLGFNAERFAQLLERMPDVEYVEPNALVYALMVPNDQYYSYQWHMPQIKMEQAWDMAQGEGVVVAVVDTGIAYEDYIDPVKGTVFKQAPDFAGTTFVAGYDFMNDDAHPNDDEGHGTHVAGTIAQTTNNMIGTTGIAFKASLMPVKVLGANGSGTLADVADGIRWAADHGAKVINLSLGTTATSNTVKNAVAYAYGKGATIVAAAGNDGKKRNMYPAAYNEYVIAVGAVRYDKQRARYSNYGSFVDLVAPGGDLNVDQNKDGYGDGVLQQTFAQGNSTQFGYYFYQGTSMATPHVAGAAALLMSKGVINPSEVRSRLESTAQDLGSKGKDAYYGSGLIDVAKALQVQTGASSAPSEPPSSPPSSQPWWWNWFNGLRSQMGAFEELSLPFKAH